MKKFIVIMSLFALSGCVTGTDFAKPTLDSFNLGVMTRADIVAAYGEPRSESSATFASSDVKQAESENRMNAASVPGSFRKMVYAYQDRSEAFVSGRVKDKIMFFTLWNDALVGYDFTSDFPEASSDFDTTKISSFTAGSTTKQDVIDTLGAPTGRAIYPAVLHKDDEKWFYSFIGEKDGKIYNKLLEILVGPDGVVADFRMSENSKPVPPPPPSAAPMPIFIPTK